MLEAGLIQSLQQVFNIVADIAPRAALGVPSYTLSTEQKNHLGYAALSRFNSVLSKMFNTVSGALSLITTGTPEQGLNAAEAVENMVRGGSVLKKSLETTSGAVSLITTGTSEHGLNAADGIANIIKSRLKNPSGPK